MRDISHRVERKKRVNGQKEEIGNVKDADCVEAIEGENNERKNIFLIRFIHTINKSNTGDETFTVDVGTNSNPPQLTTPVVIKSEDVQISE